MKIYVSTFLDESKLILQNKPVRAEIFKCVPAQIWLDHYYPKEGTCVRENEGWRGKIINFNKTRIEITNLDINNQNLEGTLDLTGFSNLKELSCFYNQLTSLDLKNFKELEVLECNNNQLTNLILPPKSNLKLKYSSFSNNLLTNLDWNSSPEVKLTWLYLQNNNFLKQNLSCLEKFINLENLYLGTDNQTKINQNIYNRWTGSLEYLKDMSKLKRLHISNTDLNSGIEYLPESLVGYKYSISYSTQARPKSKVEEIKWQLDLFTEVGHNWIRLNFTWPEIKSWLDIGLKVNDSDYAQWLRDIKDKNVDWVLNYGDDKELRIEYRKFLTNKSEEFTSKSPSINSSEITLPLVVDALSQELTNQTKWQLFFSSQLNTTQEKTKQIRIIDNSEYSSEPEDLDTSWTNLHPYFTPELIQTWKNHNFSYEEVKDWLNINSPSDQEQALQEPEFYAWLWDIKQVNSDWVLNYGDIKELKQEYLKYLGNEYQAQIQFPPK